MTDSPRVRQIGELLERVFEGDAWHGTPILTLLSGIDASQAMSRPVGGGHSGWEILGHITAWLSIVRTRVGGDPVHEIPDELDWPLPAGSSDLEWDEARQALREAYVELCASLERLSDADLANRVEGKLRQYTVYDDLHGVVQHSLYHTGQIVLLAKAAEDQG
jgi:uncharacterized damage-inducible protein DinB